MQFKKISANKYIGSNGYYLHRSRNGLFTICRGSTTTEWGKGFKTVRTAENFLNNHNYIAATIDFLPISADDIEYAVEVYGFKSDPKTHQFKRKDGTTLAVSGDDILKVTVQQLKKHPRTFKDTEKLLLYLDSITDQDEVFANAICSQSGFQPITAKSSRDITRNLVRVKSSNVWAYGVDIKDDKGTVGDVYVQFKAKNGGPGDVYKVYDVPISIWRKFIGAPSKGHFYHKYLRNNFYYSKLTGDKKGKLPNAIN